MDANMAQHHSIAQVPSTIRKLWYVQSLEWYSNNMEVPLSPYMLHATCYIFIIESKISKDPRALRNENTHVFLIQDVPSTSRCKLLWFNMTSFMKDPPQGKLASTRLERSEQLTSGWNNFVGRTQKGRVARTMTPCTLLSIRATWPFEFVNY